MAETHHHRSEPPMTRVSATAVAGTMQALASPSRVLILDRLRDHPMPVGALAAAVGMEASAVSHQLRLLRQIGIVTGERRGRQVVYALHDHHVAQLVDAAFGHLQHVRQAAAESLGDPAAA